MKDINSYGMTSYDYRKLILELDKQISFLEEEKKKKKIKFQN